MRSINEKKASLLLTRLLEDLDLLTDYRNSLKEGVEEFKVEHRESREIAIEHITNFIYVITQSGLGTNKQKLVEKYIKLQDSCESFMQNPDEIWKDCIELAKQIKNFIIQNQVPAYNFIGELSQSASSSSSSSTPSNSFSFNL